MNTKLLEKLSNADAIAANEQEVRDILYNELENDCDLIDYDGLGSIIFKKEGNQKGPKIMLCAHMDEVGFMVRSISQNGHILLMNIGSVKPLAQFVQEVKITTSTGKKIYGILHAKYIDNFAKDVYVDIGVDSQKEVGELGIEIGDMVTYSTQFKHLHQDYMIGKAFDDRLGCYVITRVLKRLRQKNHPNVVYGVMTSSEEVGIRGAKTATYKINPDIVIPIDVACFSNEWIKDHTNQRQIGKGVILTHYDKTLAPNRYLLNLFKQTSKKLNKPIQLDMFNTGGTDGGEAHKCYDGKPTVVTCIPVRYGHCAYSIAKQKDIEDMIDILEELILNFDFNQYYQSINFKGGK